MKQVLIIGVFLFSSLVIANSEKGYVVNSLKNFTNPGLFYGFNATEEAACIVQISYNPPPGITNKVYEVKLMDEFRIERYIYALNEDLHIGGRGDCPSIIDRTSNFIHVLNRPTGAPCFSNPRRVNFGGIILERTPTTTIISILNPSGEPQKTCIVRNY